MPQITARELIAFLQRQGFVQDREQAGSHVIMKSADKLTRVSIPDHGPRDLGRGTAARILRDAGFSVDDYYRLR